MMLQTTKQFGAMATAVTNQEGVRLIRFLHVYSWLCHNWPGRMKKIVWTATKLTYNLLNLINLLGFFFVGHFVTACGQILLDMTFKHNSYFMVVSSFFTFNKRQ